MNAFHLSAAGHAASGGAAMYLKDQDDGILLKLLDACEQEIYTCLAEDYANDPIHDFVPGFHGVMEDVKNTGNAYICLDNVVHDFKEPRVMDVKLGMRTYLQSEIQNGKPRGDLFKKLLNSFPSELTSLELETQTVTKSRYMEVRDANSTTGSLGYRIDGTAGYSTASETMSKQSSSATGDMAKKAFHEFACSGRRSDEHAGSPQSCALVAERIVEQLQNMRSAFRASAFIRQHECIGTSVLIAFDASSGQCRASWIDFAKTRVCQKVGGLSHNEIPTAGDQEDGLLLGLENLISAWDTIAKSFRIECSTLGHSMQIQKSKLPHARYETLQASLLSMPMQPKSPIVNSCLALRHSKLFHRCGLEAVNFATKSNLAIC